MLLIEHQEDEINRVLLALQEAGLEPELTIASDGIAGLDALFGTNPVLPDVILLNLTLPRLGGLQVLQCVRSEPRTAEIPVVVLSGSDSELDMLESYELGANVYVRKPLGHYLEVVEQLKRFLVEVSPESSRPSRS